MKNWKFNLRDRVRIKGHTEIGTVEDQRITWKDENMYALQFDGSTKRVWEIEDSLELVEQAKSENGSGFYPPNSITK